MLYIPVYDSAFKLRNSTLKNGNYFCNVVRISLISEILRHFTLNCWINKNIYLTFIKVCDREIQKPYMDIKEHHLKILFMDILKTEKV